MFDPQKLLGHVLKGALGGQGGGSSRRRQKKTLTGLPRGIEGKVGMGLLALAVAAYDHFSQGQPAKPGAVTGAPPPPPGSGTPPPPPPPAASPDQDRQALHLLRVMIAAANADGAIDAAEREAILGNARDAGLDAADVAALDAEFAAPLSLPQLLARTPPALREEAYVAALVGITADTEAETRFLAELADGLGLDAAARQRIREQVGLA